MFGITADGILGLFERWRALRRAISAAVRFTLIDKFMPWWLKPIYILYLHWQRADIEDVIFIMPNMTKQRQWRIYLGWTASLVVMFILLPHMGRAVTVYNLTGYWLAAGTAGWDFLVADKPWDLDSWTWWMRREIAVMLSALLYAFAHLHLVYKICKTMLRWMVLPTTACFTVCWCIAKWTKYSFTLLEGLQWIASTLTNNFNRSWDILDLVEAFIVEYVPERAQWAYCHWMQRRPSWRQIPKYEYRPLAKGEIRTLRLKKGIWPIPSVVQASVEYVRLDQFSNSESAFTYEAVSYRWGRTELTEDILLDGRRFEVTRSALKLLIARRSACKERILWIDAICVNQSDGPEKASQIRLMAEIYRHASRVIAFPDADWRSRVAAPLIYELHLAAMQFEGSEVVYSLDKQNKRWRWQAFEELLQNDYFGRVWVVQEIALGAKVEIFYGGLYIPWKTFFAVASRQTHPTRQLPTFNEVDAAERRWIRPLTFHPIAVMAMLRPESGVIDNHLTPTKLETILFTTCKFEASDARDKVFAVLGLADIETQNSLLTPDYTKSAEQVFQDVALFLFARSEGQSILMLAFAGTGFSSEPKEMPSWVPDLGRSILNYPFSDILSEEGRFQASLNRMVEIPEIPIRARLGMRGVVCDSLLSSSPIGPFDIHPIRGEYMYRMQIGHYMHVFTEGVLSFVQQNHALLDSSNSDWREELWRTMIADRVSRRSPADPGLGKAFPHWRLFNKLLSMAFTSKNRRETMRSAEAERVFREFQPSLENNSIGTFTQSMLEACYGRSFAVTSGGKTALVPPLSQPGDIVFIPFGAQTPYLIREREHPVGERVYQLVGETYVHGLMMGEGLTCGREQTVVVE